MQAGVAFRDCILGRPVFPANAGIHLDFSDLQPPMDPGIRRDDGPGRDPTGCGATLVHLQNVAAKRMLCRISCGPMSPSAEILQHRGSAR